MTRRELLVPEVRDRVRGYRATERAEEVFADADRRIYTSTKPANAADGWVLVSFSMPESDREKAVCARVDVARHGQCDERLWIAPAHPRDVVVTIKALGFAEYTDVFRARYEGMGTSPRGTGRGTSMHWRRTATSSSTTGGLARCSTARPVAMRRPRVHAGVARVAQVSLSRSRTPRRTVTRRLAGTRRRRFVRRPAPPAGATGVRLCRGDRRTLRFRWARSVHEASARQERRLDAHDRRP